MEALQRLMAVEAIALGPALREGAGSFVVTRMDAAPAWPTASSFPSREMRS